MKTRTLFLGAVASIALAGTANAGHFKGWYIGVEAGANWIEDADANILIDLGTELGTTTTNAELEFETGWAALATVGYARSRTAGASKANSATAPMISAWAVPK